MLEHLSFFSVSYTGLYCAVTKHYQFSQILHAINVIWLRRNAFQERNIGVICAAATALGILTNRGEFDWHVAPTETKQLGRLCAEQCKRNSVELGKLAVWYSTQLQGPATFLIGMPTITILAHNLDVCLGGLAPNELDTLKYCLTKSVSFGIMSNSLKNTFDMYRIFHSLLPSQRNHWEGIEIKQLFNR